LSSDASSPAALRQVALTLPQVSSDLEQRFATLPVRISRRSVADRTQECLPLKAVGADALAG